MNEVFSHTLFQSLLRRIIHSPLLIQVKDMDIDEEIAKSKSVAMDIANPWNRNKDDAGEVGNKEAEDGGPQRSSTPPDGGWADFGAFDSTTSSSTSDKDKEEPMQQEDKVSTSATTTTTTTAGNLLN